MIEYIERGAKIEELKQWVKNNPHATEESKMKVAYGIQLLANIPAADVEPVVRANWEREFREVPVKDGSRCVMKVLYKCAGESGCKEYSIINSKRCPNCGAHMERSGSGE